MRAARRALAFALIGAVSCRSVPAPPRTATPTGAVRRARVALSQRLPQLDGARLQAKVIEVNYGPGSVHLVSANASTADRATFVVFVLCEGDQPVSVPLSKP